MQFTVAIDGPAAAGKGTIARAVAAEFGFAHLDTGLLYRALARKLLDSGAGAEVAAEMAATLGSEDLGRDDLRTAEVAEAASVVAARPEVRAALLKYQQDFARREGGAVLDGRDIGTVVCPDAEAKLFVTASPETRAERRYKELVAGGADTTLEQVLADVRARDARDAARDVSPMAQAKDALLLDTTELSIEAAVAEAVTYIRKRVEQGRT